ncbi:hypothetical protein KZ483_15595 [Paenibacillus sp. sptzw28]|nr:hypothetical protein [Paenibacillus sp. sptzw28]QYR19354.1 hypothetical protein KZ483_15595 [Paenibacillus sp. sptzw28]
MTNDNKPKQVQQRGSNLTDTYERYMAENPLEQVAKKVGQDKDSNSSNRE